MSKKGMRYDYKEARDKKLPMSERFHYLENARHDQDSGSPNKFLGGIASATIGRKAAAGGDFDRAPWERLAQMGGVFGKVGQKILDQNPIADTTTQAQQAAAANAAAGGTMGAGQAASSGLIGAGQAVSGATDPTNPFEGKTFQITPANMVDPSLASVGIDASETFQPPMAGNEMGGKKPVFDMNTKGMAEAAFGTPAMRQASVKTPLGMSPLQGNAFIKAKIDAEKAGASTFEVDGKTYNVK